MAKFPLLLILLSGSICGASLRPTTLRCDFRTNPEGIDDRHPRLSWMLEAVDPAARDLKQSAYQIVAVSGGELWDSGEVNSSESQHVVYAGKPLTSRMRVSWKVRVWDQDGKPSAWSEPARWSMGLLEPSDWKGQWSGLEQTGIYRNPESPFLNLEGARWIWPQTGDQIRTSFELPANGKLLQAFAVAVSADYFQLELNGHQVGEGKPRALLPVYDLAGAVRPGRNEFVARLSPGANAKRGWIGALRLEFEGREPVVIRSGGDWAGVADIGPYGMAPWGKVGLAQDHALPARHLRREFSIDRKIRHATVSLCGLGLSELYLNGRKVGDDVLSPNLTEYGKRAFYVTHDVTRQLRPGRNAIGLLLGNGRYHAPRATTAKAGEDYGSPKAMLQLDIEYQDGSSSQVVTDGSWKVSADGPIRANNEFDGEDYDARRELIGWASAGYNDANWQPVEIVAGPGGVLSAQMAEPLKVTETLHPVKLTKRRPGVWIFDMGQNMVGWCRLRVSGKAGTKLVLRHAETLAPDGGLYVDNLRSARATDTYILSGRGTETWEPRFTYHGFRFVELIGYPGEPTLATLEGRVVHDALTPTSSFETSNNLLNQIHRNMVWGFRGNYRSIPTDCPQRDERQGWLGDRSLDSLSESYLFDVAAFYEKWMQDIADAQTPEGSVPDVAPSYWKVYKDDVTWPATFLLIHQMLYEQYGDVRALQRDYPAMRRWIAYMQNKYQKDGLMPRDEYGDWCVPPESPRLINSKDPGRRTAGDFLGSAYFYHLLRLMERFANILHHGEDARNFGTQAEAMRAAFERAYFSAERGYYSNGTQTSSVLPLTFGITPQTEQSRVFDHLIAKIENESKGHIGVGLIGEQWLLRLLSDRGRTDVAYQLATQDTYPSWGYMIRKGATTIWELWNGDTANPSMNSHNHLMMVGDLGAWMYGYLGGIRGDPANPGFRHILIRPYMPDGLKSTRASFRSQYGTIATNWRRDGGRIELDVTIPPNTAATMMIPASGAGAVMEGATPATRARGVRFLRMEGGLAVFALGSGDYRFHSSN